MTEPITVLVADDHAVFRAGLKAVIDAGPDTSCVAEADDGRAAIEAAQRVQPAVVVLDVRMPRLDGVAAIEPIIAATDAKILMLTTYDSEKVLATALRAGASGFLLKSSPPEEIVGAIRIVARGDSVIDPAMTRRLAARVADTLTEVPVPPEVATLTAREFEVLLLMAEAHSNAEIAAELYLGEQTVKTHVSHILAKLGVRDRIQAVVYVHRHRLSAVTRP
ncbi:MULTISPECIES: response regulator [Gordonia]|uniref:Putative two-component response regulator n=1 Tax=Gordonia sputi NBRC 100414 TaxID=1089453 RepID=H5TWS2_9ACTN|nr:MULTISPECIES: response regulator transcription factor [Gordonia]NKY93625.1 response regulator transcription factor [Gordonia sputi]OBA31963.1 DNA-binding response regulator [Gordonia sp. 852002-51296_SCH5728562-b]GAB37930.1 putative two-component response regulator [Gordonia sputi NBRC 100414]